MFIPKTLTLDCNLHIQVLGYVGKILGSLVQSLCEIPERYSGAYLIKIFNVEIITKALWQVWKFVIVTSTTFTSNTPMQMILKRVLLLLVTSSKKLIINLP